MDPVGAVSLAAAVVQFVQVATHVGNRIRKFTSNQLEVPESLRDTGLRLRLLADSIQRIRKYVAAEPDAYSDESLSTFRVYLESTEERCKAVGKVIESYLPTEDDSSAEKLKKALASLGKDGRINELADKLKEDVMYLTLFQVAPMGKSSSVLDTASSRTSHLTGQTFSNIPPRWVSYFVGREDMLSRIADAYESTSSTGPRIVILQGMGGQGKTQTALEYCRRMQLRARYSGLLWVDAATRSSAMGSFKTLADLLKRPNQIFTDSNDRIAFMKSILADWAKPWIVVFDNYDDPTEFNIPEFIPQATEGHVLITTRSLDTYRLGSFLKLEGMSEEDSLELLERRVGYERTDENKAYARNIVRRLGFLPLAIDQTGSYLHEKKYTLALSEFIPHYERNMKDVLNSTPKIWEYLGRTEPGQHTESAKSVFTTWTMSFRLLEPESASGMKKSSILGVIACFNENDISEALFEDYCTNVPLDGHEPLWVADFLDKSGNWSHNAFEKLIQTFHKLSLIATIKKIDTLIHFSIHPLIRDWINLQQDSSASTQNIRLASKMLACSLKKMLWSSYFHIEFTFQISELARVEYLSHLITWRANFDRCLKVQQPTYLSLGKVLICVEELFALFYWDVSLSQDASNLFDWLWRQELVSEPKYFQEKVKVGAGCALVEICAQQLEVEEAQDRAKKLIRYWDEGLDLESPYLMDMAIKTACYLVVFVLRHGENERGMLNRILKISQYLPPKVSLQSKFELDYLHYEILQLTIMGLVSRIRGDIEASTQRLYTAVKDSGVKEEHMHELTLFILCQQLPEVEKRDFYSRRYFEICEDRYRSSDNRLMDAVSTRATHLKELGLLSEAKALLSRCIAYARTSSVPIESRIEFLMEMASILSYQEDFEGATLHCEMCLQEFKENESSVLMRSPQFMRLLKLFAACYENTGMLDKAEQTLHLLVDIAETNQSPHYLILSLFELARFKQRMSSFEKILESMEAHERVLGYMRSYSSDQSQQPEETGSECQTCTRQSECFCAILGTKVDGLYGWEVMLSKAFCNLLLKRSDAGESDFRKAAASWEGTGQQDAEWFLEEALAMASKCINSNSDLCEIAARIIRWVAQKAEKVLGMEHLSTKKAKDALLNLRLSPPTRAPRSSPRNTRFVSRILNPATWSKMPTLPILKRSFWYV